MRTKLAIICVLIFSSQARAQVAVAPLELVRQQFLSSTGVPLAGGCLTFNATGTSTPQAIYVDSLGVIQAPNPYQLDSAGESNIWLSNTGYDLTAYAGTPNTSCAVSLGAQQWQQKNINPFAIINGGANFIIASSISDPSGVAGELAYRSDIPCFRGFTTLWDCFVMQNLTQTLSNKTLSSPVILGGTISNAAISGSSVSGSTFSIIVANAGVTGTTLNTLTKLTGAPSTAVITAIADTGGVVGITIANAGTAGNATVQTQGIANCVFDGATVAGDFVIISTTVAGNCHDLGGGGYPSSGQAIGRVLSTNGAGGTYSIDLFSADIRAPNVTQTFPQVVYNTASASTNANIAAITMVTPAANSDYRATFYDTITVVGAGCTGGTTITVQVTWQDPLASSSSNASTTLTITNGGAFNGVVGQSVQPSGTMTGIGTGLIRAKAATPIQYSVIYTIGSGCSPGPSYQVFPILEQLTAN